ncbi:hypothetical protein ZHAS_00006013 [Anopheles sinensis]|uniref:Uncharacterized protein n=1 Tax=Anopheles sinensis TaxID=74873 RepID=A0A084VKY2_ANOSI|nr:hypothetical protein ZHAS_00006013 [Anopheles sinensis]
MVINVPATPPPPPVPGDIRPVATLRARAYGLEPLPEQQQQPNGGRLCLCVDSNGFAGEGGFIWNAVGGPSSRQCSQLVGRIRKRMHAR